MIAQFPLAGQMKNGRNGFYQIRYLSLPVMKVEHRYGR